MGLPCPSFLLSPPALNFLPGPAGSRGLSCFLSSPGLMRLDLHPVGAQLPVLSWWGSALSRTGTWEGVLLLPTRTALGRWQALVWVSGLGKPEHHSVLGLGLGELSSKMLGWAPWGPLSGLFAGLAGTGAWPRTSMCRAPGVHRGGTRNPRDYWKLGWQMGEERAQGRAGSRSGLLRAVLPGSALDCPPTEVTSRSEGWALAIP